jgi:tRNA dimethylallyltransferase
VLARYAILARSNLLPVGTVEMDPIVTIVGPTATGKTDVGIAVAKAVNGEIISADSMAVYSGMDIGTAKPDAEAQSKIKFHLLDVAAPDEPFHVSRFRELALAALDEIRESGKRPLLVGGTGLYVRALLNGFGLTQTPADYMLRESLNREAEEGGTPALHSRLASVDTVAAGRIHPNDRVRIVRALEVYQLTGRPLSEQQEEDAAQRQSLPAIKFGLRASNEELARRINTRVDRMIDLGLVQEVQGLLDKGYNVSLPPLKSLGYKEIIAYLAGEYSLEPAVEEIKRNTRRFAKRQMTWFRAEPGLIWIDVDQKTVAEITGEILPHLLK